MTDAIKIQNLFRVDRRYRFIVYLVKEAKLVLVSECHLVNLLHQFFFTLYAEKTVK